MRRRLPILAASLLVLAACRSSTETPAAAVAPAATATPEEAIAKRVLDTLGGEDAWSRTRCVSWLFMGRRRLLWDKQTGDVRVESDDHVTFVNVNTREGRAFEKGAEIVDEARRAEAVEKAYAAFINDSYWMFMPYKLRDPGVHLAYVGEQPTKQGQAADVLEMTFEAVGMTPKNRYLVYVGKESGLVEQWDYFTEREDEAPRLSTPWNGWKRFGDILLCTDHGDGKDWEIAVLERPPPGAFVDPGPIPVH